MARAIRRLADGDPQAFALKGEAARAADRLEKIRIAESGQEGRSAFRPASQAPDGRKGGQRTRTLTLAEKPGPIRKP
jgi:hypothetical protein